MWLLKTSSTSFSTFRFRSRVGSRVAGVVGDTFVLIDVGTTSGEQIIGSPTCPRSGGPKTGEP